LKSKEKEAKASKRKTLVKQKADKKNTVDQVFSFAHETEAQKTPRQTQIK